VPLIASVVVASMLSPTALVFVQTFDDDASVIDVPDAIVPVRGPAGAVLAAGAGVDFAGVWAVFVGVDFVGVDFVPVDDFVGVLLAGAFAVELFAVSLSVIFELSFAIARFAASAESFLSAVESVFDESFEQPASVIMAIAKDAAVIRVYFM
jgi:hypothetical protein